jgi:hypothetical protein
METGPESDMEEEQPVEQLAEIDIPILCRKQRRPRKYLIIINTTIVDISIFIQEILFTDSRRKKINGLLEKSVFKIVNTKNVPKGIFIFNLCFVDKIKYPRTNKVFEKSRLVVQAYND